MFDLGFWEVLIIFLIGLLILGPERLARTMRVIGLWTGRARASFNSAKREVERELRVDELRRAGESVRTEVDSARREVERTGREVEDSGRQMEREARASEEEVRSGLEGETAAAQVADDSGSTEGAAGTADNAAEQPRTDSKGERTAGSDAGAER